MEIRYLDALAGAGKTRALSQYAIRLAAAGEKVLFVQPSKKLINATIRDEFPANRGFRVSAIHGDTTPGVVADIIKHTRKTSTISGIVLFITHAAFMRLPYVENKEDWHLLFDEVPTVDVSTPFNIPETYELLTQALRFEPYDAAYGKITCNEHTEVSLHKIAKNRRGDEVWGLFGDLARRVLSPHWDVFALQASYHNLIKGARQGGRLVTHSLLKPSIFSGFKQVILASALFTESTLYKLWSAQGITMEPVGAGLRQGLRYHRHDNGSLITVRYVTERDWSKALRDKLIRLDGEDGPLALRDRLPGLIGAVLGQDCFAWMGNRDIPDEFFAGLSAVRLPNSPHGLNSFQHIHHAVVLSALNACPAHFSFMCTRGISDDELRTANYRTAVYQASMRISMRDPHDLTPKSITVMDAATAHWLSALFPGSRVEALGQIPLIIPAGKPGRPRRHATNADRTRASREKQRNKRLLDCLCAGSERGAPSHGTAYASIYDTEPLLHLNAGATESFVDLLRECHHRQTRSKHENFLMSPAHIEPDACASGTRRGLGNIQHVNGIWLDNDGGDLTPDAFVSLFPTIRMVIWNTYSSTPDHLRWRCFIPTTTVMTVEDHACITRQISRALRLHRYGARDENGEVPHPSVRCHGFDTGKFNAASLFYAPCKAAIPDYSFFIDYRAEGRDALDVRQWLATDIAAPAALGSSPVDAYGRENDEDHLPLVVNYGNADDVNVNEAINRWRNAQRGDGHRAFYQLGIDLRRCGLSQDRARRYLLAEARNARSPRDRQADASNILRRLWKAA